MPDLLEPRLRIKQQSHSASSQMLTTNLSSVRDYERSDPVGMMHMNGSHISERGVRKRGELF